MSSEKEQNGTEPSKGPKASLGRPIGGVSLFGGNPGLLGDLKAHLRKSSSSEDESGEPSSPTKSPLSTSPTKTSLEVIETPPSPTTSERSNRSRTPSTSVPEVAGKLLPNLTGKRARKPSSRPPTIYAQIPVLSTTDCDNASDLGAAELTELEKFFKPMEFGSESRRSASPPSPDPPTESPETPPPEITANVEQPTKPSPPPKPLPPPKPPKPSKTKLSQGLKLSSSASPLETPSPE